MWTSKHADNAIHNKVIIIIPYNQLNIQLVILVQISTKSQNRTLIIFQLQSWFRRLFHSVGVLLQFGTSLFKGSMGSKYSQIFGKIFADQFRTNFSQVNIFEKKNLVCSEMLLAPLLLLTEAPPFGDTGNGIGLPLFSRIFWKSNYLFEVLWFISIKWALISLVISRNLSRQYVRQSW